jgi:hypothetical protein
MEPVGEHRESARKFQQILWVGAKAVEVNDGCHHPPARRRGIKQAVAILEQLSINNLLPP